MDTSTSRFNRTKYDFTRGDPRRIPTYQYPATTLDADTRVTEKGPQSRRRKIPPLKSTPYLRYEMLNHVGSGDCILCPPSWSFWQRCQGYQNQSSSSSVLRTLGLLIDDPVYGKNCPIVPLNLRSRVENDVLQMIKSQKLNIATSLAEGRETLGWLASRAASAAKAYHALREGDFKKFRNAVTGDDVTPPRIVATKRSRPKLPSSDIGFSSRTAASNWLEYNYAVVPLLLDIHGAAEALAEYIHSLPPIVMQVRARGRDFLSPSVDTPSAMQSTSGIVVSWTGRTKVTYRQTVTYRVNLDALQQLSALGVTNPAEVVWEKTKFSFLFDWLIPVGDFLSGWDATIGCTFLDGYALTHHESAYAGPLVAKTSSGEILKQDPSGIYYRGFVRKPLKAFPYPSPFVKNPFSSRHVTTAVALIRSIFFR